jgi:hypothetical protein
VEPARNARKHGPEQEKKTSGRTIMRRRCQGKNRGVSHRHFQANFRPRFTTRCSSEQQDTHKTPTRRPQGGSAVVARRGPVLPYDPSRPSRSAEIFGSSEKFVLVEARAGCSDTCWGICPRHRPPHLLGSGFFAVLRCFRWNDLGTWGRPNQAQVGPTVPSGRQRAALRPNPRGIAP